MIVFGRNPQTGTLTRTSCASDSFTGCRRPRSFEFPSSVAIGPDGRYAYVTTAASVDVFARQR